MEHHTKDESWNLWPLGAWSWPLASI